MKRKSILTWIVAVLASLVPTLAGGSAEAINLEAGQAAHDFTVSSLGGDSLSLHDYQGEAVMVVFWASWSPRCREELEFLKSMQAKYPSARFFAVNTENDRRGEENIAKMKLVVDEWKIPFVVGIDEGLKVWDLYKIVAVPTSLIIGPDGKLLLIQTSFNLNSPEAIEGALQSAIASPAPRAVALGARE